jgi:predicted permease
MSLTKLWSWIRPARQRSRMECDMETELKFHMERHIEELMRSGVPRKEAQRRARLEFGGLDQIKDACRDARHASVFESLLRDSSQGLRVLRKNPGFSALAVLTLALGIGATTAVFSLVNAVLLRPLPYQHPERLVFLYAPIPRYPGVPIEAWGPFNADFYAWRKLSRSFDKLALFTTDGPNAALNGSAVRVSASRVTGEFFQLLGVAPALGRAIGTEDDAPGVGGVAVISHRLWQSGFGADRNVLGKELSLDARPYRIVGVMPAGFAFPHGTESLETIGKVTDVWTPWAMTPQERASQQDNPGNAIGRLRPGVSLAQAQAELSTIAGRLDPFHRPEFRGSQALVRLFDVSITGTSRRALLIFMAAVFLVLLIACSNVAGLILARAHRRALELSIRAALGASRLRLIRQLLAESFILAGAGGILGALVAFLAVRLLIRIHPANIPRLEEASVDGRVLLFCLSVSLAAAVLSGLFPAWSASRCNLNEALKSLGGRSVKGTGGRLHRAFMIAEIALTMVLLAGSGLLIRSFLKLQAVDKGYAATSTVTMSIRLDQRYDSSARRNAFFRGLIARSGALPGVEAAAAINHAPLGGGQSLSLLEVEGSPFDEKTVFEARAVTPGYFAAMGIPLLDGRAFADNDAAGRPPVAVISRSFAGKYFPAQHAVGKWISRSGRRTIIVGVAGDVRQYDLEATPPMQIYTPLWQAGSPSADILVRTSLPADRVASEVRKLVRDLDPAVATADPHTMTELVSEATAQRRFQMLLMATFGGIALAMSLVGLYASMAFWVQQRTAEIGIRMALGAQRSTIVRLVVRQGSRLALTGIFLGLAGALALTRSMSSLLFDMKPADAPTFFVVAVLFCAVSLAACYIPARRATRVDPIVALRCD